MVDAFHFRLSKKKEPDYELLLIRTFAVHVAQVLLLLFFAKEQTCCLHNAAWFEMLIEITTSARGKNNGNSTSLESVTFLGFVQASYLSVWHDSKVT